jgi:DNA polymerase-3 subunit gamma/tau
MAYEVTASRKRPKNFSTLVGQEFVVATLMNAIKTRRIAHAYLFSGPRGVGKTSTARILARALNCPDESLLGTEGCFDYPGAEEISRGTAMDVIEIDGASNTSVNDVRAIKDEVLFPPQNSRYKIYIIDEVHMLSNSAFNALLKTIEEPPPYIIFIFATTEIHKVPATIRSRCQQFNFRLIPLEDIIHLLKQAADEIGVKTEEEALFWIARESTGSMRDAYTLFDQVAAFSEGHITLEKIKEKLGLLGIDEINQLSEHLVAGDQQGATEYLDSLLSSGASVEQLVIDLSDYFRALLFIRQGITRDGLLGHPRRGFSETVVQALSIPQLEKIVELLLQLYRDLRYTLNGRLELELMVSRLARIADYFEPQEIIRNIRQLRDQVAALPESPLPTGAKPGTVQGAQAIPPRSEPQRDVSAEPIAVEDPAGQSMPEAFPAKTQTAGPAARAAFTSETWKQLVESIQKERPGLGATISNARDWAFADEKLTLYFDSDMHAGNAGREQSVLREAIEGLIGRVIDIDIKKVETEEEIREEDPEVQMVKKVFRGDLLN